MNHAVRTGRTSLRAATLTVAATVVFAASVRAQQADKQATVTVLDGRSFWRALYSWDTPLAEAPEGYAEILVTAPTGYPRHRLRKLRKKDTFRYMTLYPAPGWTAVDFDDSSWARRYFFAAHANGEGDYRAGGGAASPKLRQLSLRAKFTVTDAEAVKGLAFSLAYRGGAIVYVNGKEIARAHLPAEKVKPAAPAEAYPRGATLKDDGKAWHRWNDRSVIGEKVYPLRVRRLEKVAIPSKLLVKGTNVLAMEIHAAPLPAECVKLGATWATAGLVRMTLQADSPGGIVPNVGIAKGMRVWNTSVAEELYDTEYPDPHEPLRPIRIAGTRNGTFSGRVVVSSDGPIVGVKAAASELTGPKGARIPASSIRVAYGRFDSHPASAWGMAVQVAPMLYPNLPVRRNDSLLDSPPPKVDPFVKAMAGRLAAARRAAGLPVGMSPGAAVPVWVTVDVPPDVPAGTYRGSLTVTAEGEKPVAVPVELSVADWALPEPADFNYFFGLVQCPESVALTYGLKLWSKRHWELVGRSLELIGRLGPKVLYLPLNAESQYGNAESMVVWTAAGDGKYTHDFSRVDTYVELAIKRMDRPTFVVLGVWDECRGMGNAMKRNHARFSLRDPTTGKITAADGPEHGTDASVAFWRPVLEGLRKRLASRGLGESILLGYAGDRLPNKAVVTAFHKILPEARWQATRHDPTAAVTIPREGGSVSMAYQSNVWGGWTNYDPGFRRAYGWKHPQMRTWLDRSLFDASPIPQYRIACEQALLANRRGLGQIGADFWPYKPERGKTLPTIFGLRFPRTQATSLGMYAAQLLCAGPHGPAPTARYVMIRENIQECEARIFLEKLLTAEPCPLGEKLARRCQEVLDERTRWHRMWWVGLHANVSWPHSPWQKRSGNLYAAAAEAAKAAAPKKSEPSTADATKDK